MRLHRLSLRNWRGVSERDVEFGDGVTLIEGPNEIGKSSLVEALYTLITELDSSAKQSVKAVQPVGQDVGSSVEAEISTGDYRFVYRKTYNKAKQTELDILEPRRAQLTGREAHERVTAMLKETIDPDLWEALLVDQGEKVAQAKLSGSSGLTDALDEAAGGSARGEDDGPLLGAAQAEYEKFFTLKTGRSKFDGEKKALEQAEERLRQAQEALAAVGDDASRHERLFADVRRRRSELPALQQDAGQYEEQLRLVEKTRNELELKQKDAESAAAALVRATRAHEERLRLVAKLDELGGSLRDREKMLEPHQAKIDELAAQAARQTAAVAELREQRGEIRVRLAVARADGRFLRERAELERLDAVIGELRDVAKKIESSAAIVTRIRIDQEIIDRLQDLANEIRVLEGQRDIAATRVAVRALSDQQVTIAGEPAAMSAGESLERQVASATEIEFPGVATLCIEPPAAAADLESSLGDARETLASLLKDHGAADREDAQRQFAQKSAVAAELDAARKRERELLGDRSRSELDQARSSLATSTSAYLEKRDSNTPAPDSVDAADRLAEAVQADADDLEARIHAAEKAAGQTGDALQKARDARRDLDDALLALKATRDSESERLAEQRSLNPDEALVAGIESVRRASAAADEALKDARTRLSGLNPERVRALHENAVNVAERAGKELARLDKELAVLDDRLQQAKADGRFEAAEAAERDADEAWDRYTATKRRAEAASRLWVTLNEHRDAARRAYVRPLQEAIERLGRIVFGDDFEVTLGEDWSIETRTLDGQTLPFDALSIGAQEQLGVLTRLAAARIVASQGGVPLIIDDALGFSDPSRLESMGAAIAAAGKECQVIILTCTPGRFTRIGNATVQSF